MNRLDFLRKTTIALAGGLVVGPEVMEQYERLTHRKVWALGAVSEDVYGTPLIVSLHKGQEQLNQMQRNIQYYIGKQWLAKVNVEKAKEQFLLAHGYRHV